MTEQEAKRVCEAAIICAAEVAKQKGVPRDRMAATLADAGALLMVAEVGPLGAAEILRQIADRIELGDAGTAGNA